LLHNCDPNPPPDRAQWCVDQAMTPKPDVQATFSPAARVSCRKPTASSSRARLSEPASLALRPPAVTMPIRLDLASESSPATRTVVGTEPSTLPEASVPAKLVLRAFSTLDWGSFAAISAA